MFIILGIVFFLLNCAFMLGAVWLERALSIPQYTVLGPDNSLPIAALSLILTMLAFIPISRRYYPQRRPQHRRLSPILTVTNTAVCLGEAVWIWLRPHPASLRVVGLVLFACGVWSMSNGVRSRLARSG
jgi:hypothetical protein